MRAVARDTCTGSRLGVYNVMCRNSKDKGKVHGGEFSYSLGKSLDGPVGS